MRVIKRFVALLLGVWVGGICAVPEAQAATFTFQTPISGDAVPVTVTLADSAEGDAVDIAVSIPPGAGDLLGFFGNLAADELTDDAALAPLLEAVDLSGDLTDAQFAANGVDKVGPGNNVLPVRGWDFGLRLGENGGGRGVVESAHFRLAAPGLSAARLLDAANDGWIFGVRVQSTLGAEGSAKIGLSAGIPRVAFIEPSDGDFLNASPFEFRGSVTGEGVQVSVHGVAAEVAAGAFTAEVPLEEGPATVTAVASNGAGSSSASLSIILDTVPPEVTLTAPEDGALTAAEAVAVSGTVTDTNPVQVVYVPGSETEPVGGAFELTANVALGSNEIEVFALDAANNLGSATVNVVRGNVPEITVDAPAEGAVVRVDEVEVRGRVSADTDAVSVAGTPADLLEGAFSAVVSLAEGANTLPVTATNPFGTAQAQLSVIHRRPPEVAITSPNMMGRFNQSPIAVTGTVDDPQATVVVEAVTAAVTPGAPGAPATFSAQVPLVEGNNLITAVATDTDGEIGSQTISVVLDTTPPRLIIDTPADGTRVAEPTVTVSGLVNDITLGLIEGPGPVVQVAGVAAEVLDGRFLASGIPLAPGPNTLTVTATDTAGNTAAAAVTVDFEEIVGRPRLVEISGDGQTGPVASLLPEPLVVELEDAEGNPVPGGTVIFKVLTDTGRLTTGDQVGRSLALTTDSQGRAAAFWSLGTHSGAASQVAEATAVRFAGRAVFNATALPGAAAKIFTEMGDAQTGVVGQLLPRPLMATVTDAGNNRLGGVPVTFTVAEGGGSFGGETSVTGVTDLRGIAQAELTLGPRDGVENNLVEADFPANPGVPVKFVATGVLPGDPADTRFSGVVLDHTDLPIAGVTVDVEGTPLTVQTDSEGRFEIAPVPVGDLRILVDGSTADRPGSWPSLAFDTVTVVGRNNTLGGPVHLLPLDLPNGVFVDETHGAVLTLPEMPGFALDIAAGSATFPGGQRQGLVSVTPVNTDKIPMPPNFGQQPRLIVTIQPTGVHFDPPARLTLPNVEGLLPGEVTQFYSFDHDLGTFVGIGPATVSEDGTRIVSDPGVGIVKGGWHCGGNPASQGTCCDCKECQKCDEGAGTCLPDNGASCDDGKFCTSFTGTEPGPDQCDNGSCKGNEIPDKDRGDITPREYDIRPIVNAVRGVTDALSFGPCEISRPSIAGGFKIGFFQRCCESSQSIELGEKISGSLSIKVATIECPIPGLSIPLGNFAVVGITVGVGFSGQFEGSGGQDPCGEGQCTRSISGNVGATLSGNVVAKLKINPDLLSVKGGVQGRGQVSVTQNCDEPVEVQGCVGPPSIAGEVSLLGGINSSFNFVPFPDLKLCVP